MAYSNPPLVDYDSPGQDTAGLRFPIPLTAGGVAVNAQASVTVSPVYSSTSTGSQQAISTSPVTLLNANNTRKGMKLQNGGTTVIYVLFGAGTPSSSNYTYALAAGGRTNDGSGVVIEDYTWQGEVQAISSLSGGLVNVTELT